MAGPSAFRQWPPSAGAPPPGRLLLLCGLCRLGGVAILGDGLRLLGLFVLLDRLRSLPILRQALALRPRRLGILRLVMTVRQQGERIRRPGVANGFILLLGGDLVTATRLGRFLVDSLVATVGLGGVLLGRSVMTIGLGGAFLGGL